MVEKGWGAKTNFGNSILTIDYTGTLQGQRQKEVHRNILLKLVCFSQEYKLTIMKLL